METLVFSCYLEAYDTVITIEAIFRILEKKNDFIFIYFHMIVLGALTSDGCITIGFV